MCMTPQKCRAKSCSCRSASWPAPVPLCRSWRSVARSRAIRAADAFRHIASNPFAGGFPKMWVIFVQIPVMACPRRSSSIPLCKFGQGCGAKHTVRPPATYAVLRLPVRHARADSGWGGRVGANHRMPLCVFPMQPKGHRPRKSANRAPRGAQSLSWSSRAGSRHFTK